MAFRQRSLKVILERSGSFTTYTLYMKKKCHFNNISRSVWRDQGQWDNTLYEKKVLFFTAFEQVCDYMSHLKIIGEWFSDKVTQGHFVKVKVTQHISYILSNSLPFNSISTVIDHCTSHSSYEIVHWLYAVRGASISFTDILVLLVAIFFLTKTITPACYQRVAISHCYFILIKIHNENKSIRNKSKDCIPSTCVIMMWPTVMTTMMGNFDITIKQTTCYNAVDW